jgi:hypothetical protein
MTKIPVKVNIFFFELHQCFYNLNFCIKSWSNPTIAIVTKIPPKNLFQHKIAFQIIFIEKYEYYCF